MGTIHFSICNTFAGYKELMSSELIVILAFIVVLIFFVGGIFTVLELGKTEEKAKK